MSTRTLPVRLGLCCLFEKAPIRFKTHTAKYLGRFSETEQLERLSQTILANAQSLRAAVLFCSNNSIGSFRINSGILPLKTHPTAGYETKDLPAYPEILSIFQNTSEIATNNDIRLTFHPDQFTLLSSTDPDLTRRSIEELMYHLEIANLLGVDVITLHGGGAYGDKQAALQRVTENIKQLPAALRHRLALENDDRTYTVEDLLPVCRGSNIPLVYDVHHHRCNPDSLSVQEATKQALATWNREPLFHISSPREGWNGSNTKPHHDYIEFSDFPKHWQQLKITVEVEAKAKELAVLQLLGELQSQ